MTALASRLLNRRDILTLFDAVRTEVGRPMSILESATIDVVVEKLGLNKDDALGQLGNVEYQTGTLKRLLGGGAL